jgi:hypothetical protein
MKNEERVRHFLEKELVCSKCLKAIIIKKFYIGGYWHLNGWVDPAGFKHYGSVCAPCFDKLHKIRSRK